MKKSDYPRSVAKSESYGPFEVAIILGVSLRKAQAMMDDGRVRGATRAAGRNGDRSIGHRAMLAQFHTEMYDRVVGLSDADRHEPGGD